MFRVGLSRPSLLRCPGITASRIRRITRHHAFHNSLRSASSDSHSNPSNSSGDPQRNTTHTSESKDNNHDPVTARITDVKDRLRGWSESTAHLLRERIDSCNAFLALKFSQLGKEINTVTGYGEIEELKRKVVEQEARIEEVRRSAREAKEAYDVAMQTRASSQREVNDMLQRKSTWTDADVGRFTSLVRQDQLHEQEESRAKAEAIQAEDAVEKEFSELMRVILNRYHEEQAWSDKIRSASTYGSLAVMGVNMFVFILAIVLVEPWKRRKLAQTFERKVEEMSAQSAAALESKTEDLTRRLEAQDRMLSQIMETVYYSSHVPETDQAVLALPDEIPQPSPSQQSLRQNLTPEVAWLLATSATAAGIVGWLARSWYS